ncbi:glycosyltransferase family 1 protein [Galactobacter sp.]|uniref:glycosyltransferase family 4 protein n=1 Tax=Galactobacter sp. TaxID=2676125 RepID=UPI0025C6C4CE|nr:glycosyltransferase family 1 protein [Galactobacter sp.]
MRLLIDARYTRTDHHDGISRFTASLIEALARRHDVVMLVSDAAQLPMLPDVPHVLTSSPTSPLEPLVAWRINRLNPDVVFSPMQTMGSWGRKHALVLTLHDLIYYRHRTPPGFLPPPVRLLWRLYHLAWWPQRVLLNRADVVATVSETTKRLMQQHRLTKRPIRVIPNAAGDGREVVVRDLSKAPSKQLLYMGSFMEYKNVETLIAAMAHLPGYRLHLLSGIRDERREQLQALVPAGADVVFHGGVSEDEYQELLCTVTASVTLSRDEGFGIPLVEAMKVGTPVVASDLEIFREVGEDAVTYVDPDQPEALAEAVLRLEDPATFERASSAGLERSRHFDWDHSAQRLWEVCEEALSLRNAHSRR